MGRSGGGGFSGGSGHGGRSAGGSGGSGFGGPGFGGGYHGGGYYGGGFGGGSFWGGLLGGLIGSSRNGGGGSMPPQMPQSNGPQQPGPGGSGNGGGPGGSQPGSGGPGVPPSGSGGSNSPQRKSPNSGLGTVFVVLAAVLLVVLLVVALGGGSCSGADIPRSTVERTALAPGSANETGYFTDEDGDWIHDPAKLERGLRHFYEETGVQPYVYILPNGSVRSYQELQSIAEEKYSELFTDQAHFVLVFCDDGSGRFNAAYWAGAQTGSVLDDEAINIFKGYLSQNYDDMSLSEEEIFSKAFADTADRIMEVTPSPLPIIAVCGAVIIVAVVVFVIVRNRRLARQREAERMEQILSTPLESFADGELEDLEKKYTASAAGTSDAPPVQPTRPPQ
ncbi:hypothetical protein [Adlercreutzia muris]|uniref:hypothetical protein n=1 Tax=Adlercreutzia muris TaxID=1796610 RepID=UPI00136667DD|nr:hypothetical protein [Adlercreutzia muris]